MFFFRRVLADMDTGTGTATGTGPSLYRVHLTTNDLSNALP